MPCQLWYVGLVAGAAAFQDQGGKLLLVTVVEVADRERIAVTPLKQTTAT